MLGYPDTKNWDHYAELPELKEGSPWISGVTLGSGLAAAVPGLDAVGLDLLSVRFSRFNFFLIILILENATV